MKDKLYITFLQEREPPPAYEAETIAYMGAASILDDATVYFSGTAYEITGSALWAAMDTLIVTWKTDLGLMLKSSTLFNRFKFIYPRVGGDATSHGLNLVDISTYAGTFNGGWTHDGSGALPNGTNGYMDTGIIPSVFSINDNSFGFDSKTDINGLYSDFGSLGGVNRDINMYGRTGGNLSTRNGDLGTNKTVATTDSLGLLSMKRDNSANYKVYKEGSLLATHTSASSGILSAFTLTEAAVNNTGSIIQYSPRKRTLFFGGNAMSDTEMANFTTAWRTFETTLNR